jgi:hypothetical protein
MKPALRFAALALVCALPRVASASLVSIPTVEARFVFTPTDYVDTNGNLQTYTTPSYFTLAGTDTGGGNFVSTGIVAWDINTPFDSYSNISGGLGASGGGDWTYASDGTASLSSLDVTFDGPYLFFPPFFIYQSDQITGSSNGPAQLDFEAVLNFYLYSDPVMQGSLSYAAPDRATTVLLLAMGLGALLVVRRRSVA